MDIITTQKYVRVSPKKLRLVADVVRNLTPVDAIEKLPFLRKNGSEVFIKVIKNSLASARQKDLSDMEMVFKEIQIGEGPRLKRGRAASRGRWHPYKKRMSHVRVVLTTRKSETKIEKKEEKSKNLETNKDAAKTKVPRSVKSVVAKKGDKK